MTSPTPIRGTGLVVGEGGSEVGVGLGSKVAVGLSVAVGLGSKVAVGLSVALGIAVNSTVIAALSVTVGDAVPMGCTVGDHVETGVLVGGIGVLVRRGGVLVGVGAGGEGTKLT